MDCIPQFQDFQECLKKNPEHVAAIMDDAEDAGEAAEDADEAAVVPSQTPEKE